jgi:hypothetical protein
VKDGFELVLEVLKRDRVINVTGGPIGRELDKGPKTEEIPKSGLAALPHPDDEVDSVISGE